MKLKLSTEDLRALTDSEEVYLTEWRLKYHYPKRLTIGQLIHFITDHGDSVQIQRNVSDGPNSPVDALWTSVISMLGQSVQNQPVAVTRDLQAKWDEWESWFETVDKDFTQVLIRRQMWRVMLRVYQDAPEESPLRKYGGPYMTWLAGMYGQAQSIAVRRHADTRKDVVSLKRILKDMQVDHDIVAKHSSYPATSVELQCEIDQLDELAEAVIHYTNKQVAHLDPNELDKFPTFGDLDKSLDQLCTLLQRCTLIIGAADLSPEIVDASGWTEILYHPWIGVQRDQFEREL